MRNAMFLALFLAAAVGLAPAQHALVTSPYRFHEPRPQGRIGPQSIVRDRSGNLYFVYISQFSPPQWDIAIARSTDGGKSWNLKWQSGFASNASGHYGNFQPALAIDGQGNLHCAWSHRPTSNTTQTVRYNRWNAQTRSWGTEVTSSLPAGRYSGQAALAVDSKDHVWFKHGYGSLGQAAVLRSNKPYASDLKFTAVSPAFSASGRVYESSLVVDALDRVHIAYYCLNRYTVRHRFFDGTSWSPETVLGNNDMTADWPGRLAADLQGNVYAFYGVDTQAAWNKTADPVWEVRKWNGVTKSWQSPVRVYKTTRSHYRFKGQDLNNAWVISVACDELTGEVYLVYRDFDSGHLVLARWHDGDPAPTPYARLMSTGSLPANQPNFFYCPQLRGSLHPFFNRTSAGLDLLYTVGDDLATPHAYTLYYDPFPVGSMGSHGKPAIGTTYPLDLSAVKDAGLGYQAALTLSGITPGLAIDRRFIPLVPDALFFLTATNMLPTVFVNFAGKLDTGGRARASVVIPNAPPLVGSTVHGAFVTYPGGPAGLKTISNPWRFTITR